jgi:hypothetical protein
MTTQNNTMYVTGNTIKVGDMKNVLGEDILLFKPNIDEIQGKPLKVSEDKIRKIYLEKGSNAVACEDTTFGHGKVASVVKDIIDVCDENGGDLYNVIKAMAPNIENVKYTSIMSFKDDVNEALFECEMLCKLCPRSGNGTIDPFAIPLECTVTQYVNGQKTVLIENQKIDNPEKLSIAQQSGKRHLIHPRYFSLMAYSQWQQGSALSI